MTDQSRAIIENTDERSEGTFGLSIVIPAFNEARHIERAIGEVATYAADQSFDCELIVVNDGSIDETAQLATRVGQAAGEAIRFRLIDHDVNRGKAMAVKTGILAAKGEIILFCDADMSTPIDQWDRLLPWFEKGATVVIGSRDMPDSRLDPPQPWRRRLLGRIFRAIRRLLMLPNLRDTQCGFKAFRKNVAHDVFARMIETSPAFDCEVLLLADRAGHDIKEVGVLWRDDPDSRISATRHGPAMLAALWRMRRRCAGQ